MKSVLICIQQYDDDAHKAIKRDSTFRKSTNRVTHAHTLDRCSVHYYLWSTIFNETKKKKEKVNEHQCYINC